MPDALAKFLLVGLNFGKFWVLYSNLERKYCLFVKNFSCKYSHSIGINSRATRQCNTAPYHYAVYWLRTARSVFLLARKCN